MTLSRILATGRGRLSARLVIEGLEVEFVSAKRMERTTGDGRTRVAGLDIASMRIGASADLMRATLTAEPLTVRLLDLDRLGGKRHGRVTRSLWRSPQVRCFLGANVLTSDTTITLRDASALPASGVVHIGTEAIRYLSRTTTTLSCGTLFNRGIWNSITQGHFVADGEGLSDALVTDQPVGVEGRRAILYLYGDGDDPQGDGTQRWLGVCASDVRWTGGICEIAIDPITRILEQPVGGDLSTPIKIRGIHYTSASPWSISITDFSTTPFPTGVAAILTGYFDTQADFIAAANTAITSVISGTIATSIGNGYVKLIERLGGYSVTYRTDSVSPKPIFVKVSSQIESYPGDATDAYSRTSGAGWDGAIGASYPSGWTPLSSSIYSLDIDAEEPRASIGRRGGWNEGAAESSSSPDWNKIHFGGFTIPRSTDVVSFGSEEDSRTARVYSVNAALRTAQIREASFQRLDSTTELYLGRNLTSAGSSDSLLGMLETIFVLSPGLANSGAMPLVTGQSVIWGTDVDSKVASSPLAVGRGLYAFEGDSTVLDYITPEMLVCGLYPRFRADGRFELFQIRPPLTTDQAVVSIDDSAGPQPTIEKSPRGVLSQLTYRYGYDPRTQEWDKRTITFRDVQSTSAVRTPITLEVAQLSTNVDDYRGSARVSRDDIARVALERLGLFGMPTAVLTVSLDARYMDVLIGDVVSISSSMLPDIEDGCSAIVGRTGLVVGTSLELASGAVQLAILMHTQRFAGYAPSFPVADQVSLGSNVWQIEVAPSPYSAEASAAPWMMAGDLLRLIRPDSAASEMLCTVQSVGPGPDIVTVQTASAWTPGAFEWALSTRKSDAYTTVARLSQFAFFGDAARRLAYSGTTVDAKVFL